jgi:hypothetical protein
MTYTFTEEITLPQYLTHTFNEIRGVAVKVLSPTRKNELQRTNSVFNQHTPHEAQYTS